MLTALDTLRRHFVEARVAKEQSEFDGRYFQLLRWGSGNSIIYDAAVKVVESNIKNGVMKTHSWDGDNESTCDVPTKLVGFICNDAASYVIAIVVEHQVKTEEQAIAVLGRFIEPTWQITHVLERNDLAIRKRVAEAKRNDTFIDARQNTDLRALARVSGEHVKSTLTGLIAARPKRMSGTPAPEGCSGIRRHTRGPRTP
jgi:hypothetical protein